MTCDLGCAWRERRFREGDEVVPYWRPIPRNIRSPWRQLSLAPFWFQDHRRQQLDRRVRQNVILEAARFGRRFQREPDRFREMLSGHAETLRAKLQKAG